MTFDTAPRPSLPAPRAPRVPWGAVSVFVLAAMGLAWLVALPLWLGDGLASPLAAVILPVMMWTPAAATVLVVFAMRQPVGDRARILGLWPLRPVARTLWFVVGAIAVPPLVVASGLWLAAALGWVRLDLAGLSGFAEQLAATGVDPETLPLAELAIVQVLLIPFGAVVNALAAFGEEIGWRGWLLPALRPLGVWPALTLSGAIWGIWHAPVILLGYNFGRTDLVGVALMTGGCVAWGVLLGWTRLRTGSVWPAVFAHGALNACGGLVLLIAAAGPVEMGLAGPLGVASWIAIAVVCGVLAATGQLRRRVLS